MKPEAFWLLLVVPSSILFLRKKLEGPRKPVLLGLGLMRGLLLILLIIAMSDPSIITQKSSGGPHFFIGYDGSESVERKALKSWLSNWQNQLDLFSNNLPKKLTYFRLGKSIDIYKSPDELLNSLEESPVSFSRIYEGIQDLENLVDDLDYSVVILLTDGNETEQPKSISNLANSLLYMGILPVNKSKGVRVKNFYGPSKVLKGRSFRLKCLIESFGKYDVTLELFSNGVLKETRNIHVDKGHSSVEFEQKADALGSGVFELTLKSSGDKNIINSLFEHRVQIYQPKTALVISEKSNLALQNLIEDVGFKHEFRTPNDLGNNKDFNSYSFVLIDNVKAQRLSLEIQSNLKHFVFNGGGLGMLGGVNSFGLGGYYDSPIEEALPVYMPPRSYRKSVAVIFIVDSSGSMLAGSKNVWNSPHELQRFLQTADSSQIPIWVAKNAAKQIIKEMRGIDVGVVNFNTSASLAVPIQKVTDKNMQWFTQGIDSIQAGGGTKFHPALKGASTILANGQYSRVDFIFLSDGSPSDWNEVPDILKELKKNNIRVTSIAFGEEANRANLMEMANITGGKFFSSRNVSSLAKIFEKAVEQVFGPPLINQKIGTRWVPNQRFISPNPESLPNLLGYTATSPKDRGQIVVASEIGDPVFAIWNFGLGHSFAWTPDFSGVWSAEWMNHQVLRKIMSRAFQKLAKKQWDPYETKIHVNGNEVIATLLALDDQGNPISDLNVTGEFSKFVHNRAGKSLFFRYMGDGQYVAQALVSKIGDYELLTKIERVEKSPHIEERIRFSIRQSLELGFEGFNDHLVRALENRDEDRLLYKESNLQSIFKKYQERQQTNIASFSILFLGIAIFLLCVEVLFRRFRILEELQEETKDEKVKFERMALHSLRLARAALRNGENSLAEGFYLAAHRYLKQAGYDARSQAVWDEYRVKVK